MVAVALILLVGGTVFLVRGLSGELPATATQAGHGSAFGTSLGARGISCRGMTCTLLTVPVDHRDPDGETMDVRFGIHAAENSLAASDAERPTLVIATGGPGSSGIALAEVYLELFPDAVVDRYDIILFEQRGVGISRGLRCLSAAEDEPLWSELLADGVAHAYAETSAWVRACLDEADLDLGDELDRFGTWQAAADLDAYLDHVGAGRVHLYGESYGTELAQVYAAMRPERVAGMVLDAVVDPTLDGVTDAIDQARGFSDTLTAVLASCSDDPYCAEDFPDGTAMTAWDALSARLADGPIEVELSIGAGPPVTTELTADGVVRVAASLLYTEPDHAALLRLLAAADRDELGPLARAVRLNLGHDPETNGTLRTIDGTTAGFYAIHCQAHVADSGPGAVEAFVERVRSEAGRMSRISYLDLPCLAGFAGASDEGTHEVEGIPLDDVQFPVLVLTSTSDPATPSWWAEAVAARVPNSYLFVTDSAAHGTFGRGLPCPDDAVKAFLVFGELPDDRRTECPGPVTEWYVPLPLGGPSAYGDVLEALVAVEEQLLYLPDYYFWDGVSRSAGCPYGGRLEMTWTGDDEFELDGCALLPDWPLDGLVEMSPEFVTRMTLDAVDGHFEYESSADWEVTVSGELNGELIDLGR